MQFTGCGPRSRAFTDDSMLTMSTCTTSADNAYAEYKLRLESFESNWKKRAKKKARPTPEVLAEAGLYEYPHERKDAVKCFACKVILYGWKGDNDDVWMKHVQSSPSCPYVLKAKGKEFVDAALGQKTRKPVTKQNLLDLGIDGKWAKAVSDMGMSFDDIILVALYKQFLEPENAVIFDDMQTLIHWIMNKRDEAERNFPNFESKWPNDEESQRLDNNSNEGENESVGRARIKYEKVPCKICFSGVANRQLKPCNHLVSCERCTRRLKNCPVCRKCIMAVATVTFD